MSALERRALGAVDGRCRVDGGRGGVAGACSAVGGAFRGRERLQDRRPDALDQIFERGDAGAHDGDIEFDGRPDAEERRVPGYVWVYGHGVDVDEAEDGDEAGAADDFVRSLHWREAREGRDANLHESDAKQNVKEVPLASGHLEALDDFHRQQGNGAVSDDVDACVGIPVDRQQPRLGQCFARELTR